MPDTAGAVAKPDEARRARRAIGAMFFVPFGGAWLALGADRSLASPWPAWALIAVLTLALLAVTHRIRRTALRRAGPPPEPTEADRRRDRWFHLVNGGQWVLILVVGNVLANLGLGAWVIPAVIAIVGVHFLPLARLFGARSHLVTGAALMAVAAAYPLLAPGGPLSGVGPSLAGLILWTSAAWALRPAA